MEQSGWNRMRFGACAVRHKPEQQPNAVADYIQQSLDRLAVGDPQESTPQRRRKPRKRKSQEPNNDAIVAKESPRWVVIVENMVEADELEDEDECEEIVADLVADFERFGPLQSLDLDRTTAVLALIYSDEAHARTAVESTHGRVYGGRVVIARLQDEPPQEESEIANTPIESTPAERVSEQKKTRKRRTKIKNAVIKAQEAQAAQVDPVDHCSRAFDVLDMVDAAEVEDDDEYEDVLNDTTDILRQFGAIAAVAISRGDTDATPGVVFVEYETVADAVSAFGALDGKLFGGRQVRCEWREVEPTAVVVCVGGMLEVDELEDEEDFADIQDEVEAFFSKDHGLKCVEISRSTGQVTLTFDKAANAEAVSLRLAQTAYGGRKLVVELNAPNPATEEQATAHVPTVDLDSVVDATDAMRSLLTAFLERLASLQERAHVQNPLHDKRSRRLVLGLHEVKRGLASRRIKLLLLATNLDECDVVDGKLAEIVALATRENVPIIRAMTRRKLGRVLKKHARVSCVGVYSFDGANDLYQQVLDEHHQAERLAKTAHS